MSTHEPDEIEIDLRSRIFALRVALASVAGLVVCDPENARKHVVSVVESAIRSDNRHDAERGIE